MSDQFILEEPTLPDPFEVPSLRWGVIGPGRIAESFVGAVQRFTGQRIQAVASTDARRARAFADQFGIPSSYGNYSDLLSDSDVDVVYVATRQQAHTAPVLAAIAAGKHVLVEKPLAMFPDDVRAIQTAAHAAGVLVMEALWTSYLPQSYVARSLLASRQLGEIRAVHADLGQDLRGVERLFAPEGGGALLDMGIYPVSFASMFYPFPAENVNVIGSLTEAGMDAQVTVQLNYAGDAVAVLGTSMVSFTSTSAWVDAEHYSIAWERPFFIPTTLTVVRREFAPVPIARWSDRSEIRGHLGLCYQATALAEYVGQGLVDSPVRSLADSLRDIETITRARRAIGARYPGES